MIIPVIIAALGVSFMVEAGKRPTHGGKAVIIGRITKRAFLVEPVETVDGKQLYDADGKPRMHLVRMKVPEYVLTLGDPRGPKFGSRRVELIMGPRGHLVPSGRSTRGTDVPVWALNFAREHTAEIVSLAEYTRVPVPLYREFVESDARWILDEDEIREIVERAERGPAKGRDQRVIDALLMATAEAEHGWKYGAGLVGPYALP
jgi:hypothetical protein